MTTAAPARAARRAAVHVCVDCLALPERPDDLLGSLGESVGVEYRPVKPRPAPHGGPRSRRCTTHHRAHQRAAKARARIARKVGKFRLSPAILAALWVAQGCACPCGAKAAPEIPAGVCLDHDPELAHLHDHPDDEGCIECVLGYLCPACNRDIVGRLTGRRFGTRAAGRAGAAAALRALAEFLESPPLARLLVEYPELLDAPTPDTTGVAA